MRPGWPAISNSSRSSKTPRTARSFSSAIPSPIIGAPAALDIWNANFAPLGAVNLGLAGDRTQHLLWRLHNGELGALRPKVIVLMIGTNNIGWEKEKTVRNTTEETRRAASRPTWTISAASFPTRRFFSWLSSPRSQGFSGPPAGRRHQPDHLQAGRQPAHLLFGHRRQVPRPGRLHPQKGHAGDAASDQAGLSDLG